MHPQGLTRLDGCYATSEGLLSDAINSNTPINNSILSTPYMYAVILIQILLLSITMFI